MVVVGAGALGLQTAWHLTERGVTDVTVIERGHVAGASSGLSVGIIETQYLDPLAIEVRVESMRSFTALERSGALEIVRQRIPSPGASRRGHGGVRAQRRPSSATSGSPTAGSFGPAELRRLVPDLRVDDLAGGLFGPSDGYIDGHAYCDALAAAIRERGGRVLQDTELLGCDPAPGGRAAAHDEPGRHRVRRRGQRRRWVGRPRRRHPGAPIEILPQRHQALMGRLAVPLDYAMPSIMDYVPSSGGFGVYIRDDGPGRFIAGLHTEEVIHDIVDPDEDGRDAPDEYVELVGERLAHRLPGLEDMRLGDVWAGIYPMRPDGRPVVGPHPGRPSVVTVAGAGGSGLQSSPALGRIAAEWILDGEPVHDPGRRRVPADRRVVDHPGPSRYHPRTCRLHRLYASEPAAGPADEDPTRNRRPAAWTPRRSRPRSPTRTATRLAAEAPFVNLADPARALGPDGRPAVSRRAPIWEDVPDAQWNDWRWQLSHRVNDLAEIEPS